MTRISDQGPRSRPLGEMLLRPPRYGVNAPAVKASPGLPTYIRITDISDDGRFMPSPKVSVDHPQASSRVLGEGELVFARTGASTGKSYLYDSNDGKLVYAGFLINIVPDPCVLEPAYLAVFATTQMYWDWVARTSVRSGQPGLSATEYASMPVPTPDISEQRRIVAATRQATAVVMGLESLIAKKLAVRTGVRQALLSGVTRLAGYSEPWPEVALGDHMQVIPGVALSRAQLNQRAQVRCLHYGDIHGADSPILDAAAQDMPRAPNELLGGSGRLVVGDLVFADASEDVAGVGKSVEVVSVPEEGLVAGLHTIAVRFDARLADGFKAYLQFSSAFRTSLIRLAAGTKVLATSRSGLSSVRLALPDPVEQAAIAEVLRDADVEIETLQAQLVKARLVAQGLTQELMPGHG